MSRRHPCFAADGTPKRRYPTRKLAKSRLQKGQAAYYCILHPEPCWHVGRTRYKPKNLLQEETPAPSS